MNYADLFRATLPETVLEVAALLVLAVDLLFLRRLAVKARMVAATLLGAAGCFGALAAMLFEGVRGFSVADGQPAILQTLNGTTGVAQVGILALTALTLALAVDTEFTTHVGEFVAVVLMAASGGMVVAAAQDLLVIFVGLELLSLGLYLLTAFAKRSSKSAEAALKYYLFGGMSAAFLLFGFSYLYGIAGSTNLAVVMAATQGANGYHAAPLLYVALVMVAAGLGFKVAAAPFHLWAPDTYEGAPTPAAAFIASVSKVASFALLLSIGTAGWRLGLHGPVSQFSQVRLATQEQLFRGFHGYWPLVLMVMAALSMVIGNLTALVQTSVRRLLAYSAVAHAGYMLLGLAFLQYWNLQGAETAAALLYYVLTYGLTTIGAFAAVGAVERVTGSDRMDAFLGLSKRSPLLAGTLLVLFLSLAGIPPMVGFWAKFNLFAAVLHGQPGGLALGLVALAVAMSAVSLYYYLQVLKRAYVMPAVDETSFTVEPVTMVVLLLVTLLVVAIGCFPATLQGWIAGFYL